MPRCDLTPTQLAWVSRINWAVTTVEDCYGHEPADPPTGWALYDADEDDPPIAEFTFRDDAVMVADILRAISQPGPAPAAEYTGELP